jgi:AcrR family transcriptional regulator
VGRPRANTQFLVGDPTEEILLAAARLFTVVGYTATSTREIAEAAGLRQASLFHYFARKEDLLAALLDWTVEPAFAFLDWLDAIEAPPDVRLTMLLRADVENLCSGDHNLGALLLLPESHAPRFAAYWAKRDRLRDRYRFLIAEAAETSRFVVDDVDLTTELVFGLVESVITGYERGGKRTPAEMADAIAVLVLRSLVPRRDRVAGVVAQSHRLVERRR